MYILCYSLSSTKRVPEKHQFVEPDVKFNIVNSEDDCLAWHGLFDVMPSEEVFM